MKRFATLVAFGLLLVPVFGCNAVRFNEAIVAANKKLEAVGKEFGEDLVAVLKQQGSHKKVRASYEKIKKVFADVKTDMAALKVPDDASSKELYQAHQKFLSSQESMINHEFADTVKIAEDTSLSGFEKANRLKPLMERVEKEEKRQLELVQEAQRKFAAAHNISIR